MEQQSLEFKAEEEKLLSKTTCQKDDCKYLGNKPVCYSLFYEGCKEYCDGR